MLSEKREDSGRNQEVTHELVREIGLVSKKNSGWTKELNLVSWNGADAKYDLRDWAPDHKKMSRGITLTHDEAKTLVGLLKAEKL